MKQLVAAGMVFMGILAVSPALATSYPEKPVHIVVGYPPGGASDIVARLLAQELEQVNKQSFVVENKPGVGGMLSLATIAKSEPDGYVLGLGVSGTLVTGPHLQKNALYNPKTDFTPIGMVAKVPMVLLAGPSLKETTVEGLVKKARENPGDITFASGAQAFELAMQLLHSRAGIKTTSVPYKGGAAASIDVIAGRADVMVDSIGAQQANIKDGKLRALAVLDGSRSPVLPDVPTMAEAGVPNYDAVGWIAVMAPKGAPHGIVNKLNNQIQQITTKPAFREKLESLGFQPASSSPAALQAMIESEYDKWGQVVRDSGMQPN
ncbi:MAG: tripartite tricarboxylate transporter substrate binding protein [Alcaligenaceae bacterium]|nr:tripartite tricarboxylate transporter substrate binding protein [Alcaligenaceae bacterium]